MYTIKTDKFLSAFFKSRLVFYSIFVIIATPLAYYTFNLYKANTDLLKAIYQPDKAFQQAKDAGSPLEDRKNEIIESLNAELTQESSQPDQEETRILAMLDNLWHSIQEVVAPLKKKTAPVLKISPVAISGHGTNGSRGQGEPLEDLETLKRIRMLKNVLSLAADDEVIYKASTADREGYNLNKGNTYSIFGNRSISYFNYPDGSEPGFSENRWISRFQSLEGFNTRSIIWRLHRRLELEGTWEASAASDTDPDLIGFGFRSVQALAFLQDRALAPVLMNRSKIDSGYPLSYGIGLNLRLSPELNIHFDYSHEYKSDHLIEYNGNWESSLVTDYLNTKTEDVLSIHNFFVGFRYMHRNNVAFIPLHTGFFYSTNMLNQPIASKIQGLQHWGGGG